jgi:hypothetical protein
MTQKEQNVADAIMRLVKKADPNATAEIKVEAGDDFCKADIKTDVKLDMGDVVSECGRYTSVLIRPQVTITNSKGDTQNSISFAKR